VGLISLTVSLRRFKPRGPGGGRRWRREVGGWWRRVLSHGWVIHVARSEFGEEEGVKRSSQRGFDTARR
jgi:hypothetical protein